ncbi:sigma 54-interacting transcriptional regulator [Roseiconus lacunae]|uniref:Sigma 54-interacting transcriptional regulator n=1 Tax=Roseiconus lacunae TaxID=2605694 RepID=A0ABT7PDC9_9BACT|nr:sigma 54-interacting transcriptional regulator [Roseiconus lacunae]MDM4014489.1 sigma 54-interacting transcriptional regulator [Roseiconus lacunae]
MSDSSLTISSSPGGPNPTQSRGQAASAPASPAAEPQGKLPVGGVEGAYLVMHAAGRWSDVFRLSAPAEVILGRASANQISIRSEKASRQHARVWSTPNGWAVEDLGSRNGTLVSGQRLSEPKLLRDGDRIEIAGFAIQFVRQIQSADGPVRSPQPIGGEDHLTIAMDSAAITERRAQSGYFKSDVAPQPAKTDSPEQITSSASLGDDRVRATLLQLAFDLARVDSISHAIEAVLDCLTDAIRFRNAGAYVVDAKSKSPNDSIESKHFTLVATRQTEGAHGSVTYRRPPDTAINAVIGHEGQAILARHVGGDRALAAENSQGEIDAVSMILAPVIDRDKKLLGMLHLLTTDSDAVFDGEDLGFVLAVAEILAQSLRNLSVRGKLDRSLRRSQLQIKALRDQVGDKVQIVGRSDAVREIIKKVSLVAPTGATVLVRGESGVGKELVASAIHHASSRSNGPLVCMNCAALSPSLLESELFGHEKGAFTGATDRKQGKFEAADGGTLMLDEIGEMDLEIQAKFLRVLEGHPFERVGGQQPIRVDVRVVAATNRDLQSMVAEGKFRQDLFYRLHVVEILVPPLRERGNDVVLLAQHFLAGFNEKMGRRISSITPPAQAMLLDYPWPGNIRELRNVIERAVVLNDTDSIDVQHLLLTPAAVGGVAKEQAASDSPVELSLAELERFHIERVLRHTDGNKSRAASILGIERSTLDRKLKKFAKEA